MSGHSRWAKLKHFKTTLDAKKSTLFSKLSQMITIAAREGGGNPETNFKLRLAIEKAKQANMPKENIQRAIDRGLGKTNEAVIESALYEVFFSGKVAFIIEVLTDNKNRTLTELRKVINQYNGNFAQPGSVCWMFEKKGILRILNYQQINNLEDFQLKLIDLGADDIQKENDELAIYTSPENLEKVKNGIEEMGIKVDYAEIEWFAKEPISVSPEEKKKIEEICTKLDEITEVNDYYTNVK